MNKDLRIQLPLWTIAFCILLMPLTFSLVQLIDLMIHNFDAFFVVNGTGTSLNWGLMSIQLFMVSILLLLSFNILFYRRYRKHNKENPSEKLYFFVFYQPGEILEDDEMLQQVSKNATKKVYILFANALPILAFLMVIPLHRSVFIMAILLVIIFQNLLFYNEINQYYSGNYTFGNKGKKTDQELSKVNKRVVRGIAIVCLILAVLTVGRLAQIHYHAQSIPSEMEACMEEGGTAVIEKSSLWSLTKFTCE
ncbi:hypothetical protein B4U37_13565 [Sutcliffiella horikoshii]|uniref:Uncharacterized protein n=1 Tax=Sutcliffiella horikoshii TaxID=79883 RepID=A0ABN4ZF82_9BACI|nr:hypothetical protein [Sutcliffiella horikoshii]ART77010.1 hypothetical protein B4U37_13565 [Sutcliffiella horikoshii]